MMTNAEATVVRIEVPRNSRKKSVEYELAVLRDLMSRGEVPEGIHHQNVTKTVVYADYGVTRPMRSEVEAALRVGRRVEFRQLGDEKRPRVYALIVRTMEQLTEFTEVWK